MITTGIKTVIIYNQAKAFTTWLQPELPTFRVSIYLAPVFIESIFLDIIHGGLHKTPWYYHTHLCILFLNLLWTDGMNCPAASIIKVEKRMNFIILSIPSFWKNWIDFNKTSILVYFQVKFSKWIQNKNYTD